MHQMISNEDHGSAKSSSSPQLAIAEVVLATAVLSGDLGMGGCRLAPPRLTVPCPLVQVHDHAGVLARRPLAATHLQAAGGRPGQGPHRDVHRCECGGMGVGGLTWSLVWGTPGTDGSVTLAEVPGPLGALRAVLAGRPGHPQHLLLRGRLGLCT